MQTMINACCQKNIDYSPPRNPDESNGQEEIQDKSPEKIESGKLKIGKAEIFNIFGIKVFETSETTFGIEYLLQGVYIP
jgi:hypothetical protein